jgi:hypothetical protein
MAYARTSRVQAAVESSSAKRSPRLDFATPAAFRVRGAAVSVLVTRALQEVSLGVRR